MGVIDESYYLDKNKENSLTSVPGVRTLIIPRSSTKKIGLQVDSVGTVIEWEFEVKCGDIVFGLFYEDSKEELTPVVVLDRVDAKDSVEAGVYNCEKPGNCKLGFFI